MRYLTWQLTWLDGYGYGPEQTVAANGARLEASSWVSPNVEDGTILGYLHGTVDLTLLAPWNAEELTVTEAVAFAQAILPEAHLSDDGVIVA